MPNKFSKEVLDYTKKLDFSISKQEIRKRRDIRKTLTFTIDPTDAKDFDDALSFKKLNNGNYQVGIHIADVSHYVKKGSILDKEAYERATSVYLVDRVVPMLPEILSNKVCSLRPNEEKLTFSAIFEINKKNEILKEWFGRTIIESNERLSYEEAQYVIEKEINKIPKEISITNKEKKINNEVKEAIICLLYTSDAAEKVRV